VERTVSLLRDQGSIACNGRDHSTDLRRVNSVLKELELIGMPKGTSRPIHADSVTPICEPKAANNQRLIQSRARNAAHPVQRGFLIHQSRCAILLNG
jgi:hypothetical protein